MKAMRVPLASASGNWVLMGLVDPGRGALFSKMAYLANAGSLGSAFLPVCLFRPSFELPLGFFPFAFEARFAFCRLARPVIPVTTVSTFFVAAGTGKPAAQWMPLIYSRTKFSFAKLPG